MDIKRKKELLQQWENRKPEKGIVSIKCLITQDTFLEISQDTKATINSLKAKLSMGWHPNKRLQELWQNYSKNDFEIKVIKVLKYDNPKDDHRDKLEQLREQCLLENKKASKLWK